MIDRLLAQADGFAYPMRQDLQESGRRMMRNGQAEEREARRHRRIGEWVQAVDEGRGVEGLANGSIRWWRIRLPTEAEPMALLVVKAEDEVGEWVAFVGAPSATGALLAWRARDEVAGLRWRVDKAWEPG